MLQVTPPLDESFATVAVKACVPSPPSDAVAGLMLTLIEDCVEVDVEPPPPPPQLATNAKQVSPQRSWTRAFHWS